MDLEKENAKLHLMVKSLLARIEENQRIDQHFQRFEFKLLGSNSLVEVMQFLLHEAVDHFELADVGLILVDRDHTIRELFDTLALDSFDDRLQLRHSDDFALSIYSRGQIVCLGELTSLTASRLFPNLSDVGSAALLPLMRHGQLIGSLHFASLSRKRFSADKAVDFMQHLASICAVCLENCLVYEHLQYQSRMDMLTRVSNRLNFDEEFAKELERAERSDDAISCLFVDVDHFKQINDQFGHHAGDLSLKQIAAAVQSELRKTDLLARYGGEEFVVLLPRCEQSHGHYIAERVRLAVTEVVIEVSGEQKVRPTVSVGLATWRPVGERSTDLARLGQSLLGCADNAMYEAKQAGRNCVVAKLFCQLVQ